MYANVEKMVSTYLGDVWRILRRLGVPRSQADVAAEQVFASVLRRSKPPQSGHELRLLMAAVVQVAAPYQASFSGPAEPPASHSDSMRVNQLDYLLRQLPPELRVPLVFSEFSALPDSDIAEVLGLSVNELMSKLVSARQIFRELGQKPSFRAQTSTHSEEASDVAHPRPEPSRAGEWRTDFSKKELP